jgi:tetratricopeptide (TPR) repeat protein
MRTPKPLILLLELEARADMHPIDASSSARDLESLARNAGADYRFAHVASEADFEKAWSLVTKHSQGIRLVFLAGHGRRVRSVGAREEQNILFIGSGFQDLDAAVGELVSAGGAPAVVVVDACNVSVRQRFGDNCSAAVLLANPDGDAEGIAGGGLLSRAVCRAASRPGESLETVIKAATADVELNTQGRQRPKLVCIGSKGFLSLPLVAPAVDPTPSALLAQAVAEICCRGMVHKDAVPVLEQALASIAEKDGAELAELRVALGAIRMDLYRDPSYADSLEALVTREAHRASPAAQAYALHMLGWARYRQRQFDQAPYWLSKAEKLAARSDDKPLRSKVLNTLAMAQRDVGRFGEAERRFEQSLQLKRDLGDGVGQFITRLSQGWTILGRGNFREGNEHFRQSVADCLAALEGKSPLGRSQELFFPLLSSLLLHLEGLLVARLIVDPCPKEALREIEADCNEYLIIARRFTEWGTRERIQIVDAWLKLGTNRPKNLKPLADVEEYKLNLLERLRRARLEGRAEVSGVEELALGKLQEIGLDAQMGCLAAASFLCHSVPCDESFGFRERLVRALKDQLGYDGIPDTTSPIWTRERKSLSLDVSGWSNWGPLAQKLASAQRPDIPKLPQLTEKYIQILAWVSSLLLAAEGRVDRKRIYGLLTSTFKDGKSVLLNLAQSMALCHRIAQIAKPEADWGKALKELWLKRTFLKPGSYKDVDELTNERNDATHIYELTYDQMQQVLNRHAQVIKAMLVPMQHADWPRIEDSGRALAPEADLHAALLKFPRGLRYDCGALLAVRRGSPSQMYVPHKLGRGSLEQREQTENSEFVCYSHDHAPLVSKLVLRWTD